MRHDRDFRPNPPRRGGGKNHLRLTSKIAVSLLICEWITPLKGIISRLPARLTITVFVPSPLGMRVSGTAPDKTGVVSNPRYMLVDIIYKRAKPLLTCVGPKCERKGLHSRLPRRSQKGSRRQSDQSAR